MEGCVGEGETSVVLGDRLEKEPLFRVSRKIEIRPLGQKTYFSSKEKAIPP